MRINIELDVDPSEFELASELIKTIRELTNHVKLNLAGSAGVQSSLPQPAPSPPVTDAFAKLGIEPLQYAKVSAPPPQTPHQPIAQPPPQTPHKPLPQAPPPVPQEAAPTGTRAPIMSAPQVNNVQPNNAQIESQQIPGIFTGMLIGFRNAVEAGNVQKQDEIAARVASILEQGSAVSPEGKVFEECLDIFAEYILRTDAASYQEVVTVVPYIKMLPKLPKDYTDKARSYLIPKMLKHLTIKRSMDVDRYDFFAHAEAFAAMVQLEFVSIPGAVQTIIQLLKKQDNRSAAMTMLGKTVELCYQMLKDRCEPDQLDKLHSALDSVTDPFYSYDKQYIMQYMGWEEPPSQTEQPSVQTPAAVAGPPPQANGIAKQLVVAQTCGGFDAALRALIIDEERSQIITSTDAGGLYLHSTAGAFITKLEATEHKYQAMDMHRGHNLAVLAGVPQAGLQVAPIYVAYDVAQGVLRPRGRNVCTSASISSLRFLSNSDNFVSAETLAGRQIVTLHDCTRISSNGSAAPISTFQSTQEMITAVAPVRSSSFVFLTAGKDGGVLLWDQRKPEAHVATLQALAMQPASHANANVIICLDTQGTNILAGTFGAGIVSWDLRQLQKGTEVVATAAFKVDDKVVTRIAVGPEPDQPHIAVASQSNMYMLDLDPQGNVTGSVPGQKAEVGVYFDIKWGQAAGRPALFCASSNKTLDVYKLV